MAAPVIEIVYCELKMSAFSIQKTFTPEMGYEIVFVKNDAYNAKEPSFPTNEEVDAETGEVRAIQILFIEESPNNPKDIEKLELAWSRVYNFIIDEIDRRLESGSIFIDMLQIEKLAQEIKN
jgi:hypothetical protein